MLGFAVDSWKAAAGNEYPSFMPPARIQSGLPKYQRVQGWPHVQKHVPPLPHQRAEAMA